MESKPRTTSLVVILLVAGLVGLIVLQAFLLNNAFELKEQAFRENVLAAMASASIRLQTGEAILRVFSLDNQSRRTGSRIVSTNVVRQTESLQACPDTASGAESFPVKLVGNAFSYQVGSPQRVQIRRFDVTGTDTLILDSIKQPGSYSVSMVAPMGKGGSYFYRFSTDSTRLVVNVENGVPGKILHPPSSSGEREMLVSRVVDNLWSSDTASIERTVHPAVLDSVLRRSMRESGVQLDFAYGILSSRRDSVLLANRSDLSDQLRASEFRTPFGPFDLPGPHHELAVFFPGRNAYLFGQIWPALTASILFIGVITFSFVYTLRTIMRQRRFAGLMVDFINNMTHEFKTPISTVALASEAIGRADIVGKKKKVLQYNRMIGEEAGRMKNQVDRILELAVLEKGEYEFSKSIVDVHEIIRSATENFALQIESRGGKVTATLDAVLHMVTGDATHLGTIIHNLLDNAIKYSRDAPRITIRTENRGGRVIVRVIDHGIGIEAGHLKRVFDKYYRVPTGNLHDVKGFGLGLNYVKVLVDAHGGEIQLMSTPGEGTEALLALPVTR